MKQRWKQGCVVLSFYLTTILFFTFTPQVIWGLKEGLWRDWRIELPFVFKALATSGLTWFAFSVFPFLIVIWISRNEKFVKQGYFFARCAAVLIGIAFAIALALTHRWA
ncbi:MAG: hypothetical protein ACSHX3_07020 [Litorimonas sp.]